MTHCLRDCKNLRCRQLKKTVAKVLLTSNAITGAFLVTLQHIRRGAKPEALANTLADRLEEKTF